MNVVNNHINHHHNFLHMTKADAIGSVFGGISGIIKGLVSGKIAIATVFSLISWVQAADTLLIGALGALGGLLVTKIGTWVLGLFKKKTPWKKGKRRIL